MSHEDMDEHIRNLVGDQVAGKILREVITPLMKPESAVEYLARPRIMDQVWSPIWDHTWGHVMDQARADIDEEIRADACRASQ